MNPTQPDNLDLSDVREWHMFHAAPGANAWDSQEQMLIGYLGRALAVVDALEKQIAKQGNCYDCGNLVLTAWWATRCSSCETQLEARLAAPLPLEIEKLVAEARGDVHRPPDARKIRFDLADALERLARENAALQKMLDKLKGLVEQL